MSDQDIPVIDITDLGRPETAAAIDAACREWGFFQVTGHGIEAELIAALRRQMRAFFAEPMARKRAIMRTADNPWGFYDRELTKHTLDWKQIYDYGPPDGDVIVPQWPAGLQGFETAVRGFYDACDLLAIRLLRVIAANLGMSDGSLDAYFRPAHTSFLRLNYYPSPAFPRSHYNYF